MMVGNELPLDEVAPSEKKMVSVIIHAVYEDGTMNVVSSYEAGGLRLTIDKLEE